MAPLFPDEFYLTGIGMHNIFMTTILTVFVLRYISYLGIVLAYNESEAVQQKLSFYR